MRPSLESAYAHALLCVGPMMTRKNGRRLRLFCVSEPGIETWCTPALVPRQARLARRDALACASLVHLGFDRDEVLVWLLEEAKAGGWRSLVQTYAAQHRTPAEELLAAAPGLLEAIEEALRWLTGEGGSTLREVDQARAVLREALAQARPPI